MDSMLRLPTLSALLLAALPFSPQTSPSTPQSKNSATPAQERARVPFVGCPSDGQTGPVAAPTGKDRYLRLAPETAARLAYYASAQKLGVLGPRSWHCFGTYGSNGETLYVSPEPLDAKTVLSSNWTGFAGPAIQISSLSADASGRFAVARIVARVFPAGKSFVDGVIDQGVEPASSFVFGPYPADKLVYLDQEKQIVEFETPAQTEGLGTSSRLQQSDLPIHGLAIVIVAMHGPIEGLTLLDVRLPADMTDLTPAILRRLQLETAVADR
jgi:hypothetical protein